MQLIFASNNKGKIQEIQNRLPQSINLFSLQEVNIFEELPEPFDTFQDNALAKAQYVFEHTGIATFAEDSGLVVPALNGAPGVYSARYAGQPTDDTANNNLLLKNLEGISNREAYYQAVVCLYLAPEHIHYFEGTCPGSIAFTPIGTLGFGYDPLFIPEGSQRSFAQYAPDEKNAISHRGKAVRLLSHYLNEQFR